MNIIINADDCGMDEIRNAAIESMIEGGFITSTTIMANGKDLAGAKRLYDKYKDRISFGIHLVLDQAPPVCYSPVLDKAGYYTVIDGIKILDFNRVRNRLLTPKIMSEVCKELLAQIQILRDMDIEISHIDSHHHIHTSPSMFFIMPYLLRKSGIRRIRKMRNVGLSGVRAIVSYVWAIFLQLFTSVRMCNLFCSYTVFAKHRKRIRSEKVIIELMCHPGHPDVNYKNECELIREEINSNSYNLVNYRSL